MHARQLTSRFSSSDSHLAFSIIAYAWTMKRIGLAVFALAAVLAACGRQVTPNLPGVGVGGLSPGYMSVKFDVAGTMDFTNYRYFIVFNTTESGKTPDTNPWQNNWAGYSYAIEVGGSPGSTFASVWEYLHQNCTCKPAYVQLQTTPTQLQYTPNSNGTGNEFTVTFAPYIFGGLATPSPQATPAPVRAVWLFNAFVTQPNVDAQLTFIDWLGPNDGSTFASQPYNIYQSGGFDQVVYANNTTQPGDPNAQIVSVEIANNPPSPLPSPLPH
jgi:hypothetical protein